MVAFDTSAKIGAAMAHLTDYMDDPCNQWGDALVNKYIQINAIHLKFCH